MRTLVVDAHRVDRAIDADAARERLDDLHRVFAIEIDDLGALPARRVQAIVDGEDASGVHELRGGDGELSDGPAAEHRHRVTRFDVREVGAEIAGGKDVREQDRLVVADLVGQFDVIDGRGGDDHAVTDAHVAHLVAELLDHADTFMAEYGARLNAGHGAAHEVQISAADRARGEADGGVRKMFDTRFRHLLQSDIADAVEYDCFLDDLLARCARWYAWVCDSCTYVRTGVRGAGARMSGPRPHAYEREAATGTMGRRAETSLWLSMVQRSRDAARSHASRAPLTPSCFSYKGPRKNAGGVMSP